MKYKDVKELEAGLRELADFVRDHGVELPLDSLSVHVDEFVWDDSTFNYDNHRHVRTAREKMRILAKKLAPCEKHYTGNYFDLIRRFGPVKLEFTVNRAKICERKVVGVEEVPEQVIEAYTREIIEWECTDPLLAENVDVEEAAVSG